MEVNNLELHKLKGNTYYIDGVTTNIGLYKLNDTDICLIDTGFANVAPRIYEIIKENNWNLKYIINTHCHADHIGANKYLMNMFPECQMITSQIERAFARDDKLDIGFLYGGYPLDCFDTPLMHIDEQKDILHLSKLPKQIRSFRLKGHHYDMVGFKTDDDCYFVGDAIGNKNTIYKEHILLIHDVQGYLNSLSYINSFNGNYIIPSHSEVTTNITDLVNINIAKIEEICDLILNLLKVPMKLEDLVKNIFDYYKIRISYNKFLLITSTIRSYLAYLYKLKMIDTKFEDNYLYYFKITKKE